MGLGSVINSNGQCWPDTNIVIRHKLGWFNRKNNKAGDRKKQRGTG
jgi:hypothetical protein